MCDKLSLDLKNYLLNNMNHESICKPPYNNNPNEVSIWARNNRIQIVTGMDLLRINVESEADRLRVTEKPIIDLSVEHIWSSRLTSSQKDKFKTLANEANKINDGVIQTNSDMLLSLDLQNYLLNNMNHESICKPPHNNNPNEVSIWARNNRIQIVTEMDLLRINVESEADRLRVTEKPIIDLSVEHIWSSRLTSSQKDKFKTLADEANKINDDVIQTNSDMLDRIRNLPQIDDPFYRGVDFHPAGFAEDAGPGLALFP